MILNNNKIINNDKPVIKAYHGDNLVYWDCLTDVIVPDNEIWYYTADEQVFELGRIDSYIEEEWGVNIVSNTYVRGLGRIVADSPITVIPAHAFGRNADTDYHHNQLTTVILPRTIRVIGKRAFCCNWDLTSLIMREGITTIGLGAFEQCVGLSFDSLPSTITSIGAGAFQNTKLNLSTCVNVFPDSITSIPYSAYLGCKVNKSLVLPPHITSIGEYAFARIDGLQELTIGCTEPITIESYAFEYNRQLSKIIWEEIHPHYNVNETSFNSCPNNGILETYSGYGDEFLRDAGLSSWSIE